ncbi:MAG: ExeM/NucH family extracellular endonuclease [Chloroflexi bacterium]|nr:ExeM/NucH family extracellular endonuclease [Chloroflexota bacterium]
MNKSLFKVFSSITILALMLTAVPMQSVLAAPTDLFFTEYIEGTSNNKALEIYNGTGAPVNLSTGAYNVQMFFNGNPISTLTINLTGTVASGDVFVLAQSTANATILAQADQTNGSGWFNGDDAVVLRKGSTIIDVIGQIGFDPGAEWGSGLTSTQDNTLQRKVTVEAGDPIGSDVFVPATEWDGFATDTFGGLGCLGTDCAPNVASTVPSNGATEVARTANMVINFTEAVNVSGTWFDISCATSGAHTASVSGGPINFTLNPDVDFAANELCTVNIIASQITDQDTNDPPNTMPADFTFSVTSADVQFCGDPATFIHDVQGSSASSPIVGNGVSIEGVVTADYQGTGQFSGFYVQEEGDETDADPLTSEGVFVFNTSFPVNTGDQVRVRGTVSEFEGLTEINGVSSLLLCSTGNILPPTINVNLPVASLDDFERYESMLVNFPQALVISEYFNYDRFGEMVIALPLDGETRPFTGTAIDEPGAPALARAEANSLRRITLDDGLGTQNPATLRHPNGDPFSLTNRFRGGDTVQNTVGVLTFGFGLYRIQPTGPAIYVAANPRPAGPEPVGGNLRVAAMNTLNFFLTPDYPTGNPLDNTCGPAQNVECRGADGDQPLEFTRQRDKLISALAGLNGDIIGLNELENTTGVEPLGDPTNGVVAGLNAMLGADTYAFIDTGTIGTDAIRVGMIYKPGKVVPVGSFQVLDSSDDPRFIDTKSRPALAQTFQDLTNGARFTVVVNHLKSKGSSCNDVSDPDAGDGQGNCSGTRTLAAQALVDWLATDPTGSGDPDFLIMGDLNSYAMEDPIDAIKAGADDIAGTSDDFINLISNFQGAYAYSYTFDGAAGYLDHSLANASLFSQVTGAADWHLNSDEPDVLDYDTSFKPAAQDALYEPNGYRSSDHDSVVIGLDPVNYPPELGAISVSSSLVSVGTTINTSVTFTDPDKLDTHTAIWDWGDGTTSTGTITEANGLGSIANSHVYSTAGVYTVTVTVDDGYGNIDQAAYEFIVVYDPNGGFVTGGGWINSPAGAYIADPLAVGKGEFGFVAKYNKNGVLSSESEFELEAGPFHFHSSNAQWLTLNGANAQFQGTGTVEGNTHQYGFSITVIDGQVTGGGGVDKFRLRIWDMDYGNAIVYDNQIGAPVNASPTTPLGKGSIVIHKQ